MAKKLTSKLPANIALIVGHHTALAFTSSTSSHVALEITTLTQTTNYEIVFNIADLEFLNENLVQNETNGCLPFTYIPITLPSAFKTDNSSKSLGAVK